MKLEQAREIANAVLYEGYLLYPYRHSAIKNRQRWTFGIVYPQAYSQASGDIEPWFMRTECLLVAQPQTRLNIHTRFLHLLRRESAEPQPTVSSLPVAVPAWQLVGHWQPEQWEEGIEREITLPNLSLEDLLVQPQTAAIAFPYQYQHGLDRAENYEQRGITGQVQVMAQHITSVGHEHIYKIRVQIENHTLVDDTVNDQHMVLLQSFVSTHTLLYAEDGHFLSLLDPPPQLLDQARTCENQRAWPVLVGQPGEDDLLLSSPIILYDYPQIAPESVGTLFDGTEIDEILTLRIMTLTDEEKAQIRQGDSRARAMLERVEALSPEQLMALHGTIRQLRPLEDAHPGQELFQTTPTQAVPVGQQRPISATGTPRCVSIAGYQVRQGSRVRVHPSGRADALDFLLRDKTGRVEALQQDFEQRLYLVVTLDDDPGREQWDERVLPGHRFFFFPEEIEPLTE